jgi:hypothetical protein
VVTDPLLLFRYGLFRFRARNEPNRVCAAQRRTIGNASSSATERANADTADLFTHIWDRLSDTLAPCPGGRGGSGAADFAANKRITLPDWRGAGLRGFDTWATRRQAFLAPRRLF